MQHKFLSPLIALLSPIVGANELVSVERITVSGQVLSVNESNSIKSPTPVIDVPQSLSIMTAQDIQLRGLSDIAGIIDYTPGVNNTQGEGHRDAVVFRGVRSTADFFQDGHRDDVQYYRALYNLEQVEILRGPNALLFGRGGTGGVLNRVTKKAQLDQQFTTWQTSYDQFGAYSAQIDHNLVSSADSALRVNAMYEQLANHRDFYQGERIGFNPTVTLAFGHDTTIRAAYEYIDHQRFIDRGIASVNGQPDATLANVVLADAAANQSTLSADVFKLTLEHNLNDFTKLNSNLSYGSFDKVYQNVYASNYQADAQLIELDGYIDQTTRDSWQFSSNLVSEFTHLDIEHTFITGLELANTRSNQDRFNTVFSSNGTDREWFSLAQPLTLQNWSGQNAQGQDINVTFTDLNDDTRVTLNTMSVFFQDEMALSTHLDIILGVRYDRFDIEVFNAQPTVLSTSSREDSHFSPRAGLVYKPAENISLYASYSESFLPRSGEQYTDINGSKANLDPDTFNNREIGLKWDTEDGLSLTTALFANQQRSPQIADNDPATLDVIESEITGFELQLLGQLSQQLQFNANVSYLNGEIIERSGPTGRTPRELPEFSASLWTYYQASEQFGFGFGLTHQGESYIDNANTTVLPSYSRIDAVLHYDVSADLRIQLNMENLTDELYFPTAHAVHQITVGAPFNANISVISQF